MQLEPRVPLAPCLVLGYKRPLISRIIYPLLESGVTKLYVAYDGGTSSDVLKTKTEEIKEIQQLAKQFKAKFEFLQHGENLGLSSGIPESIDWFFSQEDHGIILEDDLKFGSDFLIFLSVNLEIYRNDPSIENISGNQFFPQLEHEQRLAATYPLIWGWGTWRNRWLDYRSSTSMRPGAKEMDKSVSGYWEIGQKRQERKYLDSWAIPYARYQHFNYRKTVLPCKNLSSNFGDDQLSTHSTGEEWYLNLPIPNEPCGISGEMHKHSQVSTQLMDAMLEEKIFQIKHRHRFVRMHVALSRILNTFRKMSC